MDIHKPKPWHGVREFLKEYVIIVVGVLTALGAEQAVEWAHWRHVAEQHEQDLHASAQGAAAYAWERVAIGGCVQGRLVAMAETLHGGGSQWKGFNPRAHGTIVDYRPASLTIPLRPWPYAAWESASNDGSLLHLPPVKVARYRLAFRTSNDLVSEQRLEADLLRELTPLAFDQTLTAEAKSRYLALLARIDGAESLQQAMAGAILLEADRANFWPNPRQIAAMTKTTAIYGACVRAPSRTDFAKAPDPLNPMKEADGGS